MSELKSGRWNRLRVAVVTVWCYKPSGTREGDEVWSSGQGGVPGGGAFQEVTRVEGGLVLLGLWICVCCWCG